MNQMNETLHKRYNELLLKRVNCEMMLLKDDLKKKLDVQQPKIKVLQLDDDEIISIINNITNEKIRKIMLGKMLRKMTIKRIDDYVGNYADEYNKHYLTPIVEFFRIHKKFKHWKVMFDFVAEKLDRKFDICPISGKTISRKDFENRIVGCLTENSSDSRQHYFRNGILQPEGWRGNLFHNKKLRCKNDACNWEPYNFVRGRTWRLGPGAERPSQQVLEDAEKLYKVQGRRQRKV